MEPVLLRALLVVAGLVVLVAVGAWAQRRAGRLRVEAPSAGPAVDDAHRLSEGQLAAVGLTMGPDEAGAVLLGSPTCAPCTTVKRILGEVAERREGFRWVYADAADHLELAREHRVMRVPTLFVVDADGRILARTSGIPAQDELVAVLDREGGLDDAAA